MSSVRSSLCCTEKAIAGTIKYISQSDENLNNFLNTLRQVGKTEEVEELLGALFPEQKEAVVEAIFPALTEQAKTALGQTWEELTTGEFKWPEVKDMLLSAVGVGGAYLEKYINRPWEVAILGMRSQIQWSTGLGNESDRVALEKINAAFKRYGAAAFFSEEISGIWQEYRGEQPEYVKAALTWGELSNPAYFIPIGGVFGLMAKFTTKIPILGRMMGYTATGVQAIEKGIFYPVAKPMELGLKRA